MSAERTFLREWFAACLDAVREQMTADPAATSALVCELLAMLPARPVSPEALAAEAMDLAYESTEAERTVAESALAEMRRLNKGGDDEGLAMMAVIAFAAVRKAGGR